MAIFIPPAPTGGAGDIMLLSSVLCPCVTLNMLVGRNGN